MSTPASRSAMSAAAEMSMPRSLWMRLLSWMNSLRWTPASAAADTSEGNGSPPSSFCVWHFVSRMSLGGRYPRGISVPDRSPDGRTYPSLTSTVPHLLSTSSRVFASEGENHFCPSDTSMTNSSTVATSLPSMRKSAAAQSRISSVMPRVTPSPVITVALIFYIRAHVVCY